MSSLGNSSESSESISPVQQSEVESQTLSENMDSITVPKNIDEQMTTTDLLEEEIDTEKPEQGEKEEHESEEHEVEEQKEQEQEKQKEQEQEEQNEHEVEEQKKQEQIEFEDQEEKEQENKEKEQENKEKEQSEEVENSDESTEKMNIQPNTNEFQKDSLQVGHSDSYVKEYASVINSPKNQSDMKEVETSTEAENVTSQSTVENRMDSQYESITKENLDQANNEIESDSDSDFGGFSDASFVEIQPVRNPNLPDDTAEQQNNLPSPVEFQNNIQNSNKNDHISRSVFPNETISDINKFNSKISELVDQIFTDSDDAQAVDSDTVEDRKSSEEDSITKSVKEEGANGILNERAKTLWQELKNIPKLNPPDWKRSAIRRHFMMSIGAPIDVNEVRQSFGGDDDDDFEDEVETLEFKKVQILFEKVDEKKEKAVPGDAGDEIVLVRSMTQLQIGDKAKENILENSLSILNGIEEQLQPDLYYKTLFKQGNHEKLEHELRRFESLKSELERVLSVWNKELSELNSDHDTFSQVVENIVGYSQKLARQESLKNLGKNEKAKRKNLLIRQSSSKTGFFWNT